MISISKAGIDLGIVVRNTQPMLDFYKKTLGLEEEATIPMPGGGGTMHRLKAGMSVIKLIELDQLPSVEAAPGGIRAATGYRYWTLTIDNLDEMLERCAADGISIVVPVKDVRPSVKIAIVADPDGNWVEFLQIG